MRSATIGKPPTRTLALVAAVAVASLGSAYLLGWALSPAEQGRTSAGQSPVGTVSSPTVPARQPVPTSDPAPNPDPDAERPRLPVETGGGPFGSRMTSGSARVALTFDDGPDPIYTPMALDLLRGYDVRATFCLVGMNAIRYPDLVRAIVADGHTLCNHSWSHDLTLSSRPRSTIITDLVRTNEALRAAAPGARISYFRQPGGNWTPAVVAAARELGMTSLHWAVDPQDWRLPGASNIAATVTGSTFAGAIVLLHDAGGNRQGTVAALRTILPNLTRRFTLGALPTGPALAESRGQALAPPPINPTIGGPVSGVGVTRRTV